MGSGGESMTGDTYIPARDIAKYIRVLLKKAFPETTFKVKTTHGDTVNISWFDGPTQKKVRGLVGYLSSKGFDGMIDMAYSYRHYIMPDGEIIYGGTGGTTDSRGTVYPDAPEIPEGAEPVFLMSSFIFEERYFTKAFLEKIVKTVCERYGVDKGEVEIRESSSDSSAYISRAPTLPVGNNILNFQQTLWRFMEETGEQEDVE
jgi:prepilin-type processing-associated H-X9-DG protein